MRGACGRCYFSCFLKVVMVSRVVMAERVKILCLVMKKQGITPSVTISDGEVLYD